MNEEILCPKCGSNQLSANKKGFSGKKAVAGAVLTGGIGVLAGTIGSNKVRITCLACGHVFKPGEDQKSVQKKKQQQAKAMKSPGFWIFFFCIIGLFVWLVKSCNDTNSTSAGDNKQSQDTTISDNKQNIDISNIKFEILSSSLSDPNKRIDVYVKNITDITKLNDYFVDKYNKDGNTSILINYFDNKEIGRKYFSLLDNPKYSEKELDGFFKHYIAQYNCNPPTNYRELKFMHK